MKRIFTYIFITLFAIGYTLNCLEYLFESYNKYSISCLKDFDGKAGNTESEKDEKKDNNANVFDDHFHKNWLIAYDFKCAIFDNHQKHFPLDGYGKIIYSPPDLL